MIDFRSEFLCDLDWATGTSGVTDAISIPRGLQGRKYGAARGNTVIDDNHIPIPQLGGFASR